MSTESAIDLGGDSLDPMPVTEPETAEKIENIEGMTTDFTEKFAKLCCDLKRTEESISADKDSIPNKMEVIIKHEELLDNYFYEITQSKDRKLNDLICLAESFMSMHYIKLPFETTEHEHLYVARFFVMQSMTLLQDIKLNSKAILTAMSALNALANICFKLRNEELSLQYLNKALDLYMTYTKGQDDFPAPINILVSLGLTTAQANTINALNTIFMITLKFLIMLNYKIKHIPIDMEKITTCMHKLLKKQLENIPETVDYMSWCMEAIRLADYFSLCERFVESKNHLVLASVIAKRFYDSFHEIDAAKSDEEKKPLNRDYKAVMFTINVHWAKYGLALLFSSRKRLFNREERNDISGVNSCESEFTTQSVKKSTGSVMFPYTEKEYEEFAQIIEDSYITNYDEAKVIFVKTLQLLNKIKMDQFSLEHFEVTAEILQYVSRAYKYLAFYVHDQVSQVKLQKRRLEVLEECLAILIDEHDQITSSVIWFELAVVNSSILNVSLENKKGDKLSKEESEVINQLVEKIRFNFQRYVDNSNIIEYALQNGIIDESYQVISVLNMKYFLRR